MIEMELLFSQIQIIRTEDFEMIIPAIREL